METFKILKFSTPISIRNLISFLPKTEKLRLEVPRVKLNITKQNSVFKSTQIWNDISPEIFEKCSPNKIGLIIPGSSRNSDLSASTGIIKKRLKCHLLSSQKLGNTLNWWKSQIYIYKWPFNRQCQVPLQLSMTIFITVAYVRLVWSDHPNGFCLWPPSNCVVAALWTHRNSSKESSTKL